MDLILLKVPYPIPMETMHGTCKVVDDPLLRLTDSLGPFYSRAGLIELNLNRSKKGQG